MSLDFPLILLSATIFTGVVSLVDIIYMRILTRREKGIAISPYPKLIDYCRAFFPVLLIVFILRSFLFQPYRVPTGSLEPTVMPGDMILVNQFDYGVNMPVWEKQLIGVGEPTRGQIALFYFPVDHSFNFVKRVVGVPGDKISYINKVFYINGKQATQKYVGMAWDREPGEAPKHVKVFSEDLLGIKHKIYINPKQPGHDFYNLLVPKGEYFMVGDNRDDSDDSRYWGFVKQNLFIGRALFVWMNWDSTTDNLWHKIRWGRIGTVIR